MAGLAFSAADDGEVEDAGDGAGLSRGDSSHRVGRHGEAEPTATLACLGAAGFDGELDGGVSAVDGEDAIGGVGATPGRSLGPANRGG